MSTVSLKSTDVRSRVEPALKDSATDILAQCGLTLSDGIRLFLHQVVAQRGLPFQVSVPNAQTQEAMAEARGMALVASTPKPTVAPSVATAYALFEALDAQAQRVAN